MGSEETGVDRGATDMLTAPFRVEDVVGVTFRKSAGGVSVPEPDVGSALSLM